MAVPELDIRMAVCRQDRAYQGQGPYIGVIHRITVVLPSGKWMNVGSNPAVEAGFFSGEENWCLLRIRSRSGLRSTKTEHSCLVDLNITPCISCLPYAHEPEARPLGWLAL